MLITVGDGKIVTHEVVPEQSRGPRSRGPVGARRSRRLLSLRDTARAMSQENVELVERILRGVQQARHRRRSSSCLGSERRVPLGDDCAGRAAAYQGARWGRRSLRGHGETFTSTPRTNELSLRPGTTGWRQATRVARTHVVRRRPCVYAANLEDALRDLGAPGRARSRSPRERVRPIGLSEQAAHGDSWSLSDTASRRCRRRTWRSCGPAYEDATAATLRGSCAQRPGRRGGWLPLFGWREDMYRGPMRLELRSQRESMTCGMTSAASSRSSSMREIKSSAIGHACHGTGQGERRRGQVRSHRSGPFAKARWSGCRVTDRSRGPRSGRAVGVGDVAGERGDRARGLRRLERAATSTLYRVASPGHRIYHPPTAASSRQLRWD